MNNNNIEIPEYEIDGLVQTLKETGLKGWSKYMDVISLNHLLERGFVPSNRPQLIEVLKRETEMTYGEITTLLNKYDEWKRYLPSYSLGLNEKLDSINKRMNSVVPFRWIDNGGNKMLIGFVNEGDNIVVYDGSGNHLMKVCDINKKEWNINWNNYMKVTVPQQHYIIDEMENLKKINWSNIK